MILLRRFPEYEAFIVYDEIANHWGCCIEGRVYDITGDITDKYNWVPWYDIMNKDPSLCERLNRDCIYF